MRDRSSRPTRSIHGLILICLLLALASPPVAAEDFDGVDVSGHSGKVDWPSLAGRFDFAFVKATEGVDLADSTFADHWPAMAEAGLLRGAYHFYVTEDDPIQQAEFFLATVPFRAGDLAPVVDIELIGHDTAPGLDARLRRWLVHVETALGVKPIIYTSQRFWDQHLSAGFGDYPLWIAEYEVAQPTLPAGWQSWTLWQWRGDAGIAGVEKGADLSRSHPSLKSLDGLRIPSSSNP
ncbi:MAG: GH25 family lysozyme [Acidobacteriota bacterium]